jgi:predicted transcriptional regulator
MLPELTYEEYAHVLDAVAAEALGALGAYRPPVDALALARSLQLEVAWDERQSGRGRVVRLREFGGPASRGSILLRPDPRPERLQWAIAHEIGELYAAQVFERLAVDPREAPLGSREAVANQLAGRLLLPYPWFAEHGAACGWDLCHLKARFQTASHELIARRMLDYSTPVVIAIFDHGKRTFRRGNLPGRLPALTPQEAAAWREAHESGAAVDRCDHHLRVRAWPIHEADWKREILRTEWHGTGDDAFD